jgi:hypothetical protein
VVLSVLKKMTALRMRLQKEVFDPTDEQLVGLARVIK